MEKVSWNTVKKKLTWTNRKWKNNIKAQVELEPNFPGVATPQCSEWIIYIITYTNNPFTAPWGDMRSRLFLECPQTSVYFLWLVFFMVDRKPSWTNSFSQKIYMFCLYQFSLKSIIKNFLFSAYNPRSQVGMNETIVN